MKTAVCKFERLIALGLVAFVGSPAMFAASVFSSQQETQAPTATAQTQAQPAQTSAPTASASSLPDSPGAAAPQAQQTPPASSDQQNTAPVGTAAAPYLKPDGTPAASPTGAAIAPAKQKRKHSYAVRVGLLVGGAIAIGTVVGLSEASSSRPH